MFELRVERLGAVVARAVAMVATAARMPGVAVVARDMRLEGVMQSGTVHRMQPRRTPRQIATWHS